MSCVFKGGSIVFDGTTLTEEEKAQAVAVKSIPTLADKKDYHTILVVDKENETVTAVYEPNPRTEEQIAQEAVDAYTLDMIEKGLL